MESRLPWVMLPWTLLAACSTSPASTHARDATTVTDIVSPMDVAADETDAGSEDDVMDAMAEYDRPIPPDVARNETEDARVPERLACTFGPGAFAVQTLGSEVPISNQMPVDHIIVLIQENRSFDHYFRTLPAEGQPDVDVASDTFSNTDTDGGVVTFQPDTQRCIADPNHDWTSVHNQIAGGAMSGFVTNNDPMGSRVFTYFDATMLPFYHAVANTFAISDRYFASVPGPTWPNRLFFMAGTSFGLVYNTLVLQDTEAHPAAQLFNSLDVGGITWKDYSGGPRMVAFFPYYGILREETRPHLGTIADLMNDLAAGTLPQVAVIEPDYLGTAGTMQDEHPPGIPEVGEQFVEGVVRALMASSVWSRSVMFITYDEHGGFPDHVPPPPACIPDNSPLVDMNGPATGQFNSYGVRVPFMVVSPYARAHYVSHINYDHTSLLRFIEARFDLPALTHRDANAAIPTDLLDFVHPPFMTPPTLPHAGTVDAATVARCNAAFPDTTGL